MRATISILGLYNFDSTLFDGMVLPDIVDKPTLIDAIIAETGELTARFPDAPYCKFLITSWSRRKLYQWQRIADVMQIEYNVIENYDKYETETIESEHDDTENRTESENAESTTSGTGTRTNTGTVKTEGDFSNSRSNTGTQGETGTDTKSVTGFNSNTLVTAEQTETQHTRTDNLLESNAGQDESTQTNNLSENTSNSETGTNEVERTGTTTREGTESHTRTNRTHGNVGVTTSQQMIESELALTDKLDIYGIITAEFEDYFCLGIY